MKLRGLDEKHILKRAARDLVPASIRERSKQPYRAPDSQSFFIDGKAPEYVNELMSETCIAKAGYFEPKAVRKLFEKSRSGRTIGFGDNMAFVGILSTMLIDQMFIQGQATSARPAIVPAQPLAAVA
jgi:asparagine synthase (glutamine-hydrolysing)